MKTRPISIYYTPKMVTSVRGLSPSAAKPTPVVDSWVDDDGWKTDLAVRDFEPATFQQLCFAHSAKYVRDVLSTWEANGFGTFDPEVAATLPYTTGAMVAAARDALHAEVAVAPVSGFHHACYEHGSGFCTFNGLMVAAIDLLKDPQGVRRVGIFDCDEHYGNGTDDIIKVLNLSRVVVHDTVGKEQEKAASFLAALPARVRAFKKAGCEILLYQAGADAHIKDPLGGFLDDDELALRDRIVFQVCRDEGLPIAWNLAGGYQLDLNQLPWPVINIHRRTMIECRRVFLGELP